MTTLAKKLFFILALLIMLALLPVLVPVATSYFLFPVEGASMEPTIHDGEYVFYHSFDNEPEIGKVYAFELYLHDLEADKDVVEHHVKRIKKIDSDNCIWIEGDNPLSTDSRQYGWLCPQDYKIQGTVMFK